MNITPQEFWIDQRGQAWHRALQNEETTKMLDANPKCIRVVDKWAYDQVVEENKKLQHEITHLKQDVRLLNNQLEREIQAHDKSED